MRSPESRDDRLPADIVFAVGVAGLFVTTVIVTVIGLSRHQAFAALLVIAAVASIRTTALVAVALGVSAWLFHTGFVVNTRGELGVDGGDDWIRLMVLVSAAGVVAYLTRPAPPAARTGSQTTRREGHR